MSAQHTPGPWFTSTATGDTHLYVGGMVVTSPRYAFPNASTPSALQKVDGPTLRANAQLMAAAPDMLAALVVAREFISFERNAFADSNGQPDGTFDADEAAELADYDTALLQINAAILKATGTAA